MPESSAYQIAASDPDDGDFTETFTGTRPVGTGKLGRMPTVESRVTWIVTDDDRDFMLGFGGRYGRGRNIGTIDNVTVTQAIDAWGTAIDSSLPLTDCSISRDEAAKDRCQTVASNIREDLHL